jgi:hypothetical protein
MAGVIVPLDAAVALANFAKLDVAAGEAKNWAVP